MELHLLMQSKNYTKAIEFSSELLKEYPEDKDVLAVRARVYIDLGECQNALPDLQMIYTLYEEHAVLWYLSECFLAIDQYQKSDSIFSLYVKHDSSNPSAYIGRARARMGQGLYIEGMADIKKGLDFDSLNHNAWNMLGMCYKKLNLLDSALIAFNKASLIQPTIGLYRYNITSVYFEQGKLNVALSENSTLKSFNDLDQLSVKCERGVIFNSMDLLDSACVLWHEAALLGHVDSENYLSDYCWAN